MSSSSLLGVNNNSLSLDFNKTISSSSPPPTDAIISAMLEAEEEQTTAPLREYYPEEVLGWTLDASARGCAIIGVAVFVSTSLLQIAKEAAGCHDQETEHYSNSGDDDNIGDECEARIYGMKPSSLLTNILTVVGITCALLMPLVGAIMDHTSWRRKVGRFTAMAFTIVVMIQLLLLRWAWFGAAIAQVVLAICYSVHLVVTYAYLPELTPHSEQLVKYTARFTAAQYGSSVIFLIFMVLVLTTLQHGGNVNGDSDDQNTIKQQIQSSQISQSTVFCICTLFFGYAWTRCFHDRPAIHPVPPDQTVITVGFVRLYQTFQKLVHHHHAIKWFLVSVSLTESTCTAFSSIAITYMTDQLQFTSAENGIAILLLLLFGVPGTQVASFFTSRFNPIRSLQLCLLVWIVAIAAASVFLNGPNSQIQAYCFAMVWGLCFGWTVPSEKVLYCTIIPTGQEAELMGVYICACQILSWLPPLLFTVLNEYGFSMRIGLMSLTVYFIISFCVLFLVGDYDEAKEHAKNFDHDRSRIATAERGIVHNMNNNSNNNNNMNMNMNMNSPNGDNSNISKASGGSYDLQYELAQGPFGTIMMK